MSPNAANQGRARRGSHFPPLCLWPSPSPKCRNLFAVGSAAQTFPLLTAAALRHRHHLRCATTAPHVSSSLRFRLLNDCLIRSASRPPWIPHPPAHFLRPLEGLRCVRTLATENNGSLIRRVRLSGFFAVSVCRAALCHGIPPTVASRRRSCPSARRSARRSTDLHGDFRCSPSLSSRSALPDATKARSTRSELGKGKEMFCRSERHI